MLICISGWSMVNANVPPTSSAALSPFNGSSVALEGSTLSINVSFEVCYSLT